MRKFLRTILTKKGRYEHNVNVSLIALLADFGREGSNEIVPIIKEMYSENWDGVMQEGIELGNTPETTAFILAIMTTINAISGIPEETMDEIRKSIIEPNYDTEELDILFRLKFTFSLAGRYANSGEITDDALALGIRDIHRAIFDDDDTLLDDTVHYLLEGGEYIVDQIKGGVSEK